MSPALAHRHAGSIPSRLPPGSVRRAEAQQPRRLQLRCSAVTSVPRKRAPAPSTSRPLENAEPASNSGSSLASFSGSMDAPTSSQDEIGQNTASSAASLLASMDDAYHEVLTSVHDAEVAVEKAFNQSPVGRAWAWYSMKLELAPVRTKAVTSFFGFVLGDVMAQKIGGARLAVPKLSVLGSSTAAVALPTSAVGANLIRIRRPRPPCVMAAKDVGSSHIRRRAYSGGSVHAVRALRLGLYGLFVDGPAGHTWYKVRQSAAAPPAQHEAQQPVLSWHVAHDLEVSFSMTLAVAFLEPRLPAYTLRAGA